MYLLDSSRSVERSRAPHLFWPMSFAHIFRFRRKNREDVSKSLVGGIEATGGDRDHGRSTDPANFAAYRAQSAFITQRIVETIEKILSRSPETGQSSFGNLIMGLSSISDMTDVNNTDLHERMSILNAYYFPDRKYDGLYSRISPVNSFRVIFNQRFFGGNIDSFSCQIESYFFDMGRALSLHRCYRPRRGSRRSQRAVDVVVFE